MRNGKRNANEAVAVVLLVSAFKSTMKDQIDDIVELGILSISNKKDNMLLSMGVAKYKLALSGVEGFLMKNSTTC